MEGDYVVETNDTEDYTFVDARDRFSMLPYSLREEVIEGRSSKFFQALTRENERLARQISLMNSSFKTTNKVLKHYIYIIRPNNWLKRHGLPMRRKVKRR